MLKIRREKSFLKDLSKLKMSDKHYSKYILYISMLLNGENLPLDARDHCLNGNYSDTREFHISGDLLVIYMKSDTELVLIRIGTHSQLFK